MYYAILYNSIVYKYKKYGVGLQVEMSHWPAKLKHSTSDLVTFISVTIATLSNISPQAIVCMV